MARNASGSTVTAHTVRRVGSTISCNVRLGQYFREAARCAERHEEEAIVAAEPWRTPFGLSLSDGTVSVLVRGGTLTKSNRTNARECNHRDGHSGDGVADLALQAAFGWEGAHLHRYTTEDPFAPLRRSTAKCRKSCVDPRRDRQEPAGRPEEGRSEQAPFSRRLSRLSGSPARAETAALG
jgi:hypothetical protein